MKRLIAVLVISQLCCLAVAETVVTAASFWFLNDSDVPTVEYDGANLPAAHFWVPPYSDAQYARNSSRMEVTDTKIRLDSQHSRTNYYSAGYFRNSDARIHAQYFIDQDTPWTLTVDYQGTIRQGLNDLDITITNASTGEIVFELDTLITGVYSGVLPLGLYDLDCNYDFTNTAIPSGQYDMAQMLMTFEWVYTCPTLVGDFDGNGAVDLSDLVVMLSNFAYSCP